MKKCSKEVRFPKWSERTDFRRNRQRQTNCGANTLGRPLSLCSQRKCAQEKRMVRLEIKTRQIFRRSSSKEQKIVAGGITTLLFACRSCSSPSGNEIE
jgi:hypothetical protein